MKDSYKKNIKKFQITKKKIDKAIFQMAKDLDRHFTKETINMAIKYEKRKSSTLLDIK